MDESVINRAVYAELRDTTGAEFVAELVDTFLEEGPGMLAELRDAHADDNLERFRRAAHSLKTNGNTFGALKLPALSARVRAEGPRSRTEPRRGGFGGAGSGIRACRC